MASTNKTSLGLNQWISVDKPKWADFNSDNQIIDAEIKKRAEIDSDGRVKQDAKNSQALGGKDYTVLFDSAGAAKNALALSGHTYAQLFDPTGAAYNSQKFAGQAYSNLFDSSRRALTAANSLKLGGVSASSYVTMSTYTLSLVNGFKTRNGASTIKAIKMGKLVFICGALKNSASSSNDRSMFIVPEAIRPSYMVNYKYPLTTTGFTWLRDSTGEFMAQGAVTNIEMYVMYMLD